MKIKTKYIILAAVGAVLTPMAVKDAYEVRESLQFGSEWFLVFLFPALRLIAENFKEMYKEAIR